MQHFGASPKLLVWFSTRLTPLILIRVCGLTRQLDELVYRCDQHTAQLKEEKRRLSLYFLIVTFLTNKRLLITNGRLRMEKTKKQKICCKDFCANENLFSTLFYCVKVYFTTFLTMKLCKQFFFLKENPLFWDPAPVYSTNRLTSKVSRCWFVFKQVNLLVSLQFEPSLIYII